ncbi:acetyl-CoA synthetase, putative [Plasmodium malariae]|uniref:acetate--CoA ligase n=1 Tax=Plasmodium malariae TaxID=5858 RepID=A0A1A8W4V4_PLAMA|nr:acetyl-CoA synthetase, putative [Plasmodium malariae]SBS87031.1 acetyl-CoA synthetase, putative (ACS) [Plasmodium malariae]SCO93107.1 acetyl-CoA synthetase, putative [Plasmodium malariae]
MNNTESCGILSKIDSGQLNVIDIDQSIFLNKHCYPVNEFYGEDDNETSTNNQLKNVKIYKEMYEESINNPEMFWGNIAKSSLRWSKVFTKVYIGNFKKGNVSWFINGKINACENCVDRWVEKHPNKTAIIWEKDTPNDYKKISYQKLLEKTCKVANLLKMYGVKKQDTVTIYLPMIPELVYSMLACARIGAIHNVVFAGYFSGSLCDRILDSRSTILITCDFGIRGGKLTKLKQIADGAMDMCGTIKTCIVFKNKTNINDISIYNKTSMQNHFYHSNSIDSPSTILIDKNNENRDDYDNSCIDKNCTKRKGAEISAPTHNENIYGNICKNTNDSSNSKINLKTNNVSSYTLNDNTQNCIKDESSAYVYAMDKSDHNANCNGDNNINISISESDKDKSCSNNPIDNNISLNCNYNCNDNTNNINYNSNSNNNISSNNISSSSNNISSNNISSNNISSNNISSNNISSNNISSNNITSSNYISGNNNNTPKKVVHTLHKKIFKNNNLNKKFSSVEKIQCNKVDNDDHNTIYENDEANRRGYPTMNGKESRYCKNNIELKNNLLGISKNTKNEKEAYNGNENRRSNFDENICTLKEGRDIDGSSLMKNMRSYCPIEYVDSEDFLCLLYTSGSTGKPKGVAHTTAGYLIYAYTTCKYIFDVKDDDIFGCVADIGWVTGHSYVLYGPLLNGITTVLFSSIPTYPDCGRYWNLIQTHKVTQFYTAPTALRALMKHGDHFVEKYDLSSCRILGSVGEPINPETWRWYYNVIGKKKCVIVDTYWQTETGGIVIAPIPNLFKMKPGCATLPFFGVELEILDSNTLEPVKGTNVCGLLCIKSPWPGMLRTVFGNHNRLIKTYFSMCPNYYFTGDGAYRDEDGYYWISGRIDDTLNVSGHRLGAAEIEHALVQHFCIAEAAVVSFHHNVKGEGILCFVVKKKGELRNYMEQNVDTKNNVLLTSTTANIKDMEELKKNYTDDKIIDELKLYVRQVIGPIATPDIICIVPDLPKTRSGKIVRRILRAIANGLKDFGDITTVSNYEIIDIISHKFKECKEKGQTGS